MITDLFDGSNSNANIVGLNRQAQAFYVWSLFCVNKKNILVVTNTLYEANSLYKKLAVFDSNSIYLFPMDDFLVSESLAISPDLMINRISTLNNLVNSNTCHIVITNLMGYLRFLPTKESWKKLSIKLSVNEIVDRNELIKKLNLIGYGKVNLVSKTGEYASRGYILDIFPCECDNAVRIEFFDNQIEEIRLFNVDDQLSFDNLDEIIINPITEFINIKEKDIPNRQSLLPRVIDEYASLSKYLDNHCTIFLELDDIMLGYENIVSQVFEYSQTDEYKIDKYMYDIHDLEPSEYITITEFDSKESKNKIKYHTRSIDLFNGDFEKLRQFIINEQRIKNKVLVYLPKQDMIDNFIENINLKYVITNPDSLNEEYVNIIKCAIPNGFVINNYVCISDNEIYKKNQVIKYKNILKYGYKIKDINKLEVGDYVVHASHGIGRYLGLITLENKGIKKDYIHIQYRDNDKLYIPVEKIELINKYSSNEGIVPKLNKLSGTDWAKQKARVKAKVSDIAKDLLNVSIQRKLKKGFAFLEDDNEQYKFEENFPYELTKDQVRAINEIKSDMEKENPMDRLLCGDVGYGKTEVAFRAIFKAIKSGKQVCFLCPTTILSKQHYDSAIDRFNGFGVNIEVLNRFVSEKKKKEIMEGLESGRIDLIIGTHNLLNKNIKYRDLGLLIIDEEQRFGVTHKEKIKGYKNNIDILTLSATPIPRTLQMSLSGVRELSLIETPPKYRYPVQTYVLKENSQIIKEAIYKELSRDGQVFILYNRVMDIEEKMSEIKKIVPDAKITCIHGKMNKMQIEESMDCFSNGEYDVMVCTTIIETGIDIQNANTLIILDADHFGLSQLYQIRGRIGRGTNIGYAYLMYNPKKILSEIATKRLSAIKEFTELGSGYALAMRDLAIRGAGDVLGTMQSGFIDSIGYDMYIKILNEEVQKLKGKDVKESTFDEDKQPLIQVATHIDDKYVKDEDIKIEIHKRINEIDSYENLEKISNELTDRFGNLSDDIKVYMYEELFEVQAKNKGVEKVEQLPDKIEITFNEHISKNINGAVLLTRLFKINNNFSVLYKNNHIKVILQIRNLDKHFVYYLIELLEIIE